jgi:Flp pilus assembly protein TadB
MPGLWILLFVSTLAIFLAAALVWLRVSVVNHNRKLARMFREVDPAAATVKTTVLEAAPAGKSGRPAGFLDSGKDVPGEAARGGPRSHRQLILTAGSVLVGMLAGSRFQGVLGPASLFIGGLLFAALPHSYLARKHRARMAAIEEQFPDALDFIARSVRAGNALSISLEMLAGEASEPLRSEFLKVSREQALGASLDAALGNLVSRVPLVETRFFVSAVLLQREAGGNLAEVLSRLANSVRERLRLRGHVRAISGQGRLTAAVLTVLPIVVIVLLKILSSRYLEGLTGDPHGRMLLGAAVLSQILGYLSMRKIVNIEV